jgi:chemotaxis protein MotB
MYSLSKVDKAKFEVIASSLAQVFPVERLGMIPVPGVGGQKGTQPGSTMRNTPPPEPKAQPPPESKAGKTALETLSEEFQKLVRLEGLGGSVSVATSASGHLLVVRLSESLLFGPGNANLMPEAQDLIDKIAAILATTHKHVRIEGHTDNVPIHTAQFASNWELSTARASSVIRYMIDKFGFSPEMLSASGYGEYRPVAPNDTPENRAKNRRVEFVISDAEEERLPPS